MMKRALNKRQMGEKMLYLLFPSSSLLSTNTPNPYLSFNPLTKPRSGSNKKKPSLGYIRGYKMGGTARGARMQNTKKNTWKCDFFLKRKRGKGAAKGVFCNHPHPPSLPPFPPSFSFSPKPPPTPLPSPPRPRPLPPQPPPKTPFQDTETSNRGSVPCSGSGRVGERRAWMNR